MSLDIQNISQEIRFFILWGFICKAMAKSNSESLQSTLRRMVWNRWSPALLLDGESQDDYEAWVEANYTDICRHWEEGEWDKCLAKLGWEGDS